MKEFAKQEINGNNFLVNIQKENIQRVGKWWIENLANKKAKKK